MEILHESCAGLDVHKKQVTACVRQLQGRRVHSEVRTFGTMTRDILQMSEWLASHGVTHVAMESTGVFWKPIYNLLEGTFELLLCNAKHIKQVPGRKTDVKDAEWIAQLLQCGLLKPSFVPPRHMRELRDLTRHRAQLVEEKTRIANRIHKTLEDANIKLGSVASDILGVSGRAMIQAIIAGQKDPVELAELARRQLRGKIPQLRLALEGGIREHHRYMLGRLYRHLLFLEDEIEELSSQIESRLAAHDAKDQDRDEPLPFGLAVQMLSAFPGIDIRTAQNVLAEIGTDMTRFPDERHLASWAGVCPGNNESAGKRKNGKATKGNRWLRRALSQAAWGASRTKKSYFAAQFRRLSARRGKKRAIIAVAHSLLSAVYHVLARRCPYQDLGPDFFDKISPERTARYHVKRLRQLGYSVELQLAATA